MMNVNSFNPTPRAIFCENYVHVSQFGLCAENSLHFIISVEPSLVPSLSTAGFTANNVKTGTEKLGTRLSRESHELKVF